MQKQEIPTWNNIPVAGEVHGYLAVPENVPHYYDAQIPSDVVPDLFQLQVVAVGYDGQGNIPDDPPIQYQSPLYHRAKPVTPPGPDEHVPALVTDGGRVVSAGWAAPTVSWLRPIGPGQGAVTMTAQDWTWVNIDGTMGTAPGAPGTPGLAAYIGQVLAAADALKAFTQK